MTVHQKTRLKTQFAQCPYKGEIFVLFLVLSNDNQSNLFGFISQLLSEFVSAVFILYYI